MTLRKVTIDNSVRYVPKIKPKTIKAGSIPRKQYKNFSQNSKKFLNTVATERFAVPRRIMNCYF